MRVVFAVLPPPRWRQPVPMLMQAVPQSYPVCPAFRPVQTQHCICLRGYLKLSLSVCPLTHSHNHTHSLSFVLVVVMKPKELETKISHAHSLILSLCAQEQAEAICEPPSTIMTTAGDTAQAINVTLVAVEVAHIVQSAVSSRNHIAVTIRVPRQPLERSQSTDLPPCGLKLVSGLQ